MQYNLATILTFFRIALIPVLFIVFYLPFHWTNEAAAAIFAGAAVTDWLDGWVARRYGQTSSFGAFLDPVADKLMVVVALILLVHDNPSIFFVLPAVVIVGREITISALREWMAGLGETALIQVVVVAKIKTTAQMVAVLLLLYEEALLGVPVQIVGHTLLWVAAALTIWSMVVYVRAAWPAMREDRIP